MSPFFVFLLPGLFLNPLTDVSADIILPLKAVNLGNWLVTEGWMMPSRFDQIPNNDLLDGTRIQLKSVKLNKYVCAENGGGTNIVVNRDQASTWETFRLWRINPSTFNFRVLSKQFIGLSNQGKAADLAAVSNYPGPTESLQIIRNPANQNLIRSKASNGMYLQVKPDYSLTADYQGSGWADSDPSVFNMEITGSMSGEYQITNGFGPERAPQVMQDHWNTYIKDADFQFLSQNGINAVRIPVGWWIMYDRSPPKPFVGGSLKALDNAFLWADKYNMKVIVDLHAVKASQNGDEHSGARDGYIEWGESNIQETVDVIDFLAKRYAKRQALAAIELMNEPWSQRDGVGAVSLGTLMKYYEAGYNAVRKYTQDAYVIMSNRLGPNDPRELLQFATRFYRVVIDVHYYNLFEPKFESMTAQQNVDYILYDRAAQLGELASTGPLTFVGEWTGAMENEEKKSTDDFKRFAQAQINVYGQAANFGWAYWSYRCEYDKWSLRWMISNNYINLKG